MLDFMNYSSKTFGNLSYKYENLTMSPYFSEKSEKSMMRYNTSSSEFTIRVEGGLDEIKKYIGPLYLIRVVLYDQQGLYTKKDLWLNITLNYKDLDPEVAVAIGTRIDTEVIGKINYISVFGEVDIEFEQNRLPV
jgi:hypothetical protein